MNDIQRATLLKHRGKIARDLIVSESLLGALYQRGVIKQEMVDTLRVCQLPNDKVHKLLDLIPKCGPDAFDGFVDILDDQYEWLAKLLKESVSLETENILAQQAQSLEVQTPRETSSRVHLDSDIRARVSGFVQRQFGNMRKISMSDKKQIENWVAEWLQKERQRLSDVFDKAATNAFENPQIKERLWVIHKLIHDNLRKTVRKKKDLISSQRDQQNNNNNQNINVNMETENLVDLDADDMTFSLIEEELNETIERLQYLEKQVKKSYQYLGFPKTSDKEISVVVQDLYREYRQKERELAEEKKESERKQVELYKELYEYSTSDSKMKSHINHQEHKIRTLEEQISDISNENCGLREEITVLQRQVLLHLEKEQTLTELRQTKEDLQSMLNNEKKKNEDLRRSMKDYRAPLSKLYQTKKSAYMQNNNSNGNKTVQPPKVSLKRNPPKKKSQSFRT